MTPDVSDVDRLEAPPQTASEADSATWSYMQRVLDDALDAVQQARVRGDELADRVEQYKRAMLELEDRCEMLERQCESTRQTAAESDDALALVQREQDALQERYAQALLTAMSVEETTKRARGLERRLVAIAEAVARLDEKSNEIHYHYGNDLDAQPELIEEINFARDEALEVVRRAVRGLRTRTHA